MHIARNKCLCVARPLTVQQYYPEDIRTFSEAPEEKLFIRLAVEFLATMPVIFSDPNYRY